jgi:hypothetical protein
MKKITRLTILTASVVCMALITIVYKSHTTSVVHSYDPFRNIIFDPDRVPTHEANTLQLKTFFFLTPTPIVPFDGNKLQACGAITDPTSPYYIPNNENTSLITFSPAAPDVATINDRLILWYRDEHPLVLGVGNIEAQILGGTTKVFDIEPYPGLIASFAESVLGQSIKVGAPWKFVDAANIPDPRFDAVDATGRPMFPSLFITDISFDTNSTAGDFENSGVPIPPHEIYGQWKVLTKSVKADGTLEKYAQDPLLSGTNSDPPGNLATDGSDHVSLGGSSNTPVVHPAVPISGHGNHITALSWDISKLSMQTGNTYRVQFIVHDGDPSRAGGDVAEVCGTVQL